MEQNFAKYLESAFEQLRGSIQADPNAPAIPADSKASLPELFTLLGTRTFDQDASSGSSLEGISKEEVARFLVNVFQKKLKPSEVLSGDNRDAQFRAAAELLLVAAAKSRGIDVKPDEARQILQLLETGEFFNDLSASTAAVVYCIPGLPIALLSDAKGALSPKLVTAVLKDLFGIVGTLTSLPAVESILEDLRDGTFDHPPKVMTNTLTELYRKATVRTGLRTIHQVYAKDNQSVRLATILYARSNQVDLTNEDIDLLLNTAFNPDNPDLGPALAGAFAKVSKERKLKLPPL